jgi:hypothetical protein
MNRAQTIAAGIGGVIIVLTELIPPWLYSFTPDKEDSWAGRRRRTER